MLNRSSRFDPQPFHTEPEAAAETEYGGLIASGWHTAGLMRTNALEYLLNSERHWFQHLRGGSERC